MSSVLNRALTPSEREHLGAWQRSDQRVKFVRARILLLAETAPGAQVVARAVGLAGPAPRPRSGLPRRFGEATTEALIALLHERPEAHGADAGRWTPETAARALTAQQGEAVSRETVRRLLKRRRYSWQRAKEWIVSPDPQYAFKERGAPV
jgi:transposase